MQTAIILYIARHALSQFLSLALVKDSFLFLTFIAKQNKSKQCHRREPITVHCRKRPLTTAGINCNTKGFGLVIPFWSVGTV